MVREAMLAASGLIATASGATLAMSQTVPGVPEDLKSWPATAILGLICLGCLTLVYFVSRRSAASSDKAAEAQVKAAAALGELCGEHRQTNARLDEVCQKLGETNRELTATRVAQEAQAAELHRRPCIRSDS